MLTLFIDINRIQLYEIPLKVIPPRIGQTIRTKTIHINPLILHNLSKLILYFLNLIILIPHIS